MRLYVLMGTWIKKNLRTQQYSLLQSRIGTKRRRSVYDMRYNTEVIEELVSLVLMQDEEIKKLNRKINRIKQYLEVYEEFIEGVEIQNGDSNTR